MANRKSDEQRIMEYFQSAPLDAVRAILPLCKAVVAARLPKSATKGGTRKKAPVALPPAQTA